MGDENDEAQDELDRLQHIIADVFVALYPPTPGDGTVRTTEHTEMPAHVRQVVAERDRLRELIEQSSLGTPAAKALRDRTPPGVGRAIVRASQYLARAEAAEAERDRLRAVVERAHDHVGTDEHVLRSLATDDLVALVGVLRQDCRDAMVENDRLRAVVEAARAYVEAEVDDQCPDAEYFRDGLVAALAALDVSADIGGGIGADDGGG